MAKVRSWWRIKKIRHRDAVALSVLSSAMLLAGQVPIQEGLYQQYLLPVAQEPLVFAFNMILIILAYTSYFGGILVLLGGINFLWGRIGRGRFLVSLGIGISTLILLKQISLSILTTGSAVAILVYFTTTLSGLGLIVGFVSYVLMHEYAIMLKKHAKNAWRQWRRSRRPRPSRRRSRLSANGR